MFLKSASALLVLLYFVSYLIHSPRFILNLYFISGLQSAFYTGLVLVLYLVPSPGLQSAVLVFTDRKKPQYPLKMKILIFP